MSAKVPTPRARLKILRGELRYAQMMVRMEARGLAASKDKVKRIAAAMRSIQREMK